MLRQLSGLPELVFPNERDNTYESRDEWNGCEHPYNRIQKSTGQECQPVDTADEKGGPHPRHGGVEPGIVFLPDEAHIRNECNRDFSPTTPLLACSSRTSSMKRPGRIDHQCDVEYDRN